MTDREKNTLIDILNKSFAEQYEKRGLLTAPHTADDLLANGVIVPVRCKDCRYSKSYERIDGQEGFYCQHQNCTFQYGTNWERLYEPVKEANDFCSYGERKEREG